MRKKILFAVGGTGGHLFPAQALARELEGECEVLFGGGKLTTNPFFEKEQFSHKEVRGSSPFRGNPLKAAYELSRGVGESLKILSEFSPDLLIGFGSFYSFPLLAAARIKKTPYLLVESNVLPGKVNRLFSSKALLSAIQFEEAAPHLKGKPILAKMPLWSRGEGEKSKQEARAHFGLDPDLFTLLVLGGSQGAESINKAVASLELAFPYQVIHLCGKEGTLKEQYEEKGIRAAVKPFEKEIHLAYQAADLTICRAGAGTLTELLAFEVPAILIPWPGASEDHQLKNARSFAKWGGAHLLQEGDIGNLKREIEDLLGNLNEMKGKLEEINRVGGFDPLSRLVMQQLEEVK